MERSKSKSLPRTRSLPELVGFFETRDMGEYWDKMPEAKFDVAIRRRTHLIAIDEEIVDQLTQIAMSRKISSGTLVNSWLKEKIRKAS